MAPKVNALKGAQAGQAPNLAPADLEAFKRMLEANPALAKEIAKVSTVRAAAKVSDKAEVLGLAMVRDGEHVDVTVKFRLSYTGRATAPKVGEPGWTHGSWNAFASIGGQTIRLYGGANRDKGKKPPTPDEILDTVE